MFAGVSQGEGGEKMAKPKWKIERERKRAELEESLIGNLDARGMVEDLYRDKVEEYMALWDRLQDLRDDIRKRGVSVMDAKRGMPIENRSVSLEVQVSRQMLAIYTALGFKVRDSGGSEDGMR